MTTTPGLLPARWPTGFPLPSGSQVVRDESEREAVRVAFAGPVEVDLRGFFLGALLACGWTVLDRDDLATLEVEGHGRFGAIEFDGQASFTVQFVE